MSARINYPLSISSLDLMRVKLLDILAVELDNQVTISGNDDYKLLPLLERFTPLNIDEYPVLNVRFVQADLESQDQTGSFYNYTFWVEYYTSNEGDDFDNGYKIGALKLTKVLTGCRELLKTPIYKHLDLPKEFVGIVRPTTIQVSEQKYSQNSQDALDIMYGRLTVEIRASESVGFITPELIEEHNTLVKLYDTNKGFRYNT